MEAPLPLDCVVVAAGGQLSTSFDDEVVILGLRDSAYYGLSQVGSRVWTLLQSPRTLGELIETIVAEYAVGPDQAAGDLRSLIAQLHAHGLVDFRPAAGS